MKSIVKKILARYGSQIISMREAQKQRVRQAQLSEMYQHFLKLFISTRDKGNFFFLQVGGHDGKTGDPLYAIVQKHQLAGIIVEPQEAVFKELQKNYASNKNVTCLNVAISQASGTENLYTADVPGGSLNASFNKEVITKTIQPKIPYGNAEEYLKETPVMTLSFKDLAARHNIRRIDLLQIDCEGYDYEIIKLFEFKNFSPKLINYESKHLGEGDKMEAERLLRTYGYEVFEHGSDTCAYKTSD